ncbi:MAG: hypothetical protein E7287_03540 [Lachnospiraceae bacterium]|nr:hypothetical protein [Lachnospiraceae bacterium]
MSGIYGVLIHLDKRTYVEADIDRLARWNKAYGVTVEQKCVQEKVYLGCSYEKYSETAPVSSPVLVRNGKYAVLDVLLYNRAELLEKGRFSDALSDEELLFDYIEKFGFASLEQVNGDFAGAVYDPEREMLTLFRDHMGVRPLFYYMTENELVFSTDIRGPISMQGTDASVNGKWLCSKLAGTIYSGTENTEFANIFCVKPASYMIITLQEGILQAKTTAYWQAGRKKVRLASEAAYIERMRELITDSVQRRLDVISGPMGAELSGGLDSSVIDILIHRLGREAVYVSWSASPEEIPYAEADERLIVEDICKQENISCHYRGKVTRIGKDSVIADKMRDIGMEPDVNAGFYRRYVFPPYINTLQICQVAQYVNNQGCKVVFTGHGGDEGVSHRSSPYEMFYNREYKHYFQYMWDSTRGERHRLYKTIIRCHKNLFDTGKKVRSPFVSVFVARAMLKKDYVNMHYRDKGESNPFHYDPKMYVRNGGSRNRLDVVALLGAYCGARYIAPYLDYRVIDYAVSIPRHMYTKNQKSRYIFREAFKDIMPKSLYELTGKEDTSWRNIEKGEPDVVEYLERKQRLFGMLDREYWSESLDMEYLEKWSKQPYDNANEALDMAIFGGIDNCLSLQNLISFSRQI